MFPNSMTAKKFLLAAGLLLVLGQGLWKLPEVQDYLFPRENMELILRRAGHEWPLIEGDLTTLNERLDYLKWFQDQNGSDRKVAGSRLLAFPFSESIRPLAPKYFWQVNIILAHKTRMRTEERLRYLGAFLKGINGDFRVSATGANPANPTAMGAVPQATNQIQQLQNQCKEYNAKLMQLSEQLAWLENNGYQKKSALLK